LYFFCSSFTSGAMSCIRFWLTIWRRNGEMRMIRMRRVRTTMAIAMLPVTVSMAARTLKSSQKIGVKSQARSEIGLAPGWAGSMGGGGDGVGGIEPSGPIVGAPVPGTQAATTSTTPMSRASGRSRTSSALAVPGRWVCIGQRTGS
jgi:hypothetical protein